MLVNAYFLQGSFLSVSKSLFNDLTLQQPCGVGTITVNTLQMRKLIYRERLSDLLKPAWLISKFTPSFYPETKP